MFRQLSSGFIVTPRKHYEYILYKLRRRILFSFTILELLELLCGHISI